MNVSQKKEEHMRKKLLLSLAILGLLSCFQARPVTVWNGNIVADVVDDDIDIQGDCTIVGPAVSGQIGVSAITQDITITPDNKYFIGGRNGGESDLYFYAAAGRTIEVDLTNFGLEFRGSADGTDMLVTFSGAGTMVFMLGNGREVEFRSEGDSGGVRFMVHLNGNPNVDFKRVDNTDDSDVTILVGARSIMSYIATDETLATEIGRIRFFPANSTANTGRMILKIEDTGAVYIGGNKVTDIPDPQLADIDMTTPAGNKAELTVRNNDGQDFFAGLLVLNYNTELTDLLIDPWFVGAFSGVRRGFVLGANGQVDIRDETYLDYVGLTNNICPDPDIPERILMGRLVSSVVKKRNPSAFIVDGNPDPNATNAEIILRDDSGLYLRSGVGMDGTVSRDFTVEPENITPGAGEIVFDIEGQLFVDGRDADPRGAIQLLSLEVDPSGGPLLFDGTHTNFPLRTFDKDGDDNYVVYNKGAFLINNHMILDNTYLVHTDANHLVCENNSAISEPTYIGGESFTFEDPEFPDKEFPEPKIIFYNSYFFVHTSVALAGVDLFVPNLNGEGNDSTFTFFGNGLKTDDGSGRNMILGARSPACDGCTTIDDDAHLDIFQDSNNPDEPLTHILRLTSSCNNEIIWDNLEYLCGPCPEEQSIHTIYLGNSSNISIGNQGLAGWEGITNPVLSIEGNYFSFETQGGPQCCPELGGVTGKGAIFVDYQGKITIEPCYRANVSTMVVQSGDGIIDLPKKNVFFDKRIGITDWKLDLSQKTVLIPEGQKLSDYTLYWIDTEKDYGNFCPWSPGPCIAALCCCPTVTTQNFTNVPVIEGEVDQFQIKGARFADPATILINGGCIRELVFFGGCNSAEAASAIVVLRNEGKVGLGTAHRNVDSLCASIVLGINGITLIAEGSDDKVDDGGEVKLNEDVEINNICHILAGPNFGKSPSKESVLRITSDVPKEFRVKSGGVLNLCSFTEPDQVVEFGGLVTLVLEPGAKIYLNGGTLRFTDNASISCSSVEDLDVLGDATDVTSTDEIRVKFIGVGTVEFQDLSGFIIEQWAYVGIETDDCINTTSLVFDLQDSSILSIDGDEYVGGAFQVGNTTYKSQEEVPAKIHFSLLLNGENPGFRIGGHSFLGLGIGVVDNTPDAHNDWKVGCLYNLNEVKINIESGTFSHERTYAGSDPNASLFAIQAAEGLPLYTFDFDPIKASILGGGNVIAIGCDREENEGYINPVVEDIDGQTEENVWVGIMSSKMFLHDIFGLHKVNPGTTVGYVLYLYLKVACLASDFCNSILATAAQGDHNESILGYVIEGLIDEQEACCIVRTPVASILGRDGSEVDHEHSQEIGTVGVRLGYSLGCRNVMQAFEMP